MARWDNEKIVFRGPDIEKIRCRNCKLRADDTSLIKGALYDYCGAYGHKPTEVLFKNADCPHFVDENEK